MSSATRSEVHSINVLSSLMTSGFSSLLLEMLSTRRSTKVRMRGPRMTKRVEVSKRDTEGGEERRGGKDQ